MTSSRHGFMNKSLLFSFLIACPILASGLYLYSQNRTSAANPSDGDEGSERSTQADTVRVNVIQPKVGDMDRVMTQMGTVQAYESVKRFSQVSGYLKSQKVDIGDHVKKGEVLAVIDVPELDADLERRIAGVESAEAQVKQMEARVTSATADLKALKAKQTQSEAAYRSAGATLRFREKQYQRMKDLYATKSIDERLVDEKHEQRDAAAETERSAKAAIETANAQVAVGEAKILQVNADLDVARADQRVAKAEKVKAKAMVDFATITSPFTGVVTQRNFDVGAFIRSAATGGLVPLLTIARTDKVRVVVQIPDRDTPYATVGDTAAIEFDALPGKKFKSKISRIADAEDPQTRLMRVEVDLPNPDGKLRGGMYGRATILLEKVKSPSVPSSCLVGKTNNGKSSVFIVRDGHAHKVPVEIGQDNGVRVGILHGLTGNEQVIRRPPNSLADGDPVVVDSVESANSH